MKTNRKTTATAPTRRQRRAAPKQAAPDAIKTGPVIVAGTDAPEPAPVVAEPVKAGLPAVIPPPEPLDVSAAVQAMAALSARINPPRPFMDWDFLQIPAVALAALVLKLAVLAII